MKRCSFQSNRGDSLFARPSIYASQEIVNTRMPLCRMGSLLLEKSIPAGGTSPAKRVRQQRRDAVHGRHRARNGPLEGRPVGRELRRTSEFLGKGFGNPA